MKRIFLFVLLSLIPLFAWSDKQLIDRTIEVQTNEKNPVIARTKLNQEATEKASMELIKEIIGESKFNRSRDLINSKIIRQSSRFIPISKTGDLEILPDGGHKLTAVLKMSVSDLQSLLLENGLFYETDGTPIVIPAVRWVDRVQGSSYSWWSDRGAEQKPFLRRQSRSLEKVLKTAFAKQQFYILKPQEFRFQSILPDDFRSEVLSKDDWQSLAQRFSSQIVLDGEFVISKSTERSDAFTIEIRLTANQVMNGRTIAEVIRKFETDGGSFEVVVDRKMKEVSETVTQDIASQILEAWQKGSVGASLYKLTLKGRLPLIQQESFKEVLRSNVREIKNIRERLISSDQIVFEVDSALSPKEIGQKSPKIQLGTYEIMLESSSESEITYRLKR